MWIAVWRRLKWDVFVSVVDGTVVVVDGAVPVIVLGLAMEYYIIVGFKTSPSVTPVITPVWTLSHGNEIDKLPSPLGAAALSQAGRLDFIRLTGSFG
jgi:hypothetical protein